MTTRTVKMYGKAYGENVSLQASFNNVEIVNGTVISTNTAPDITVDWNNLDVIATFSLDSSVTGDVPFTATVTGGTFVFHTFHADYCGDVVKTEVTTDAEGNTVYQTVTDENGNPVIETASADNINDISFGAESPDTGHNNIVIAGESRTRDLVNYPELTGPWNWTIDDGETMSMTIEVSAVN